MPRLVQGESGTQARLAAELRAAGRWFTHVPNEHGVALTKAQAARRWLSGVEAGLPDLLIFEPPPSLPGFAGAALELKEPGRKATDAQLRWLAHFARLGWAVAIEAGYDAAHARLLAWGYVAPTADLGPLVRRPAAARAATGSPAGRRRARGS